MITKKRVGELCKDFQNETGVYVLPDRVRRLHKDGLIGISRNEDSFHREFTPDEIKRTKTVLMLVELGVSQENIKKNSKDLIRLRLKSIETMLKELKKIY
jgi:DNA-binding transcriptional MerR regulator